MKKVLIEMEKIGNPASGLGQFCLHLGNALMKASVSNLSMEFYLPSKQKQQFGDDANYVSKKSLHKFIPLNSVEYDVWHCLHQDSKYLPGNKNTRLITTIHDLNFMLKYRGFKRKMILENLKRRLNRTSAITVISKFTEDMVRQHLDLQVPVHVIYNGNTLKEAQGSPAIDLTQFGSYFFSMGIISEKKNFHVLIPLLLAFPDMHLVLAGNATTKYAAQLLVQAQQLQVADRFHLLGIVSENTKYHLYKNCQAFLFPSLAEGFGLPVIEAMSLGKPVFLSTRTSLPEIGGQEAFYWDNFHPDTMATILKNGMNEYDSNPAKRSRIIQWSKKFSWETAANDYLRLYQTV